MAGRQRDRERMSQALGLPLMTVGAYAAERGLRRSLIHASSRVDCGEPIVVPAGDADFYSAGPSSYDFPEIMLTEIEGAQARGRSNLLTAVGAVLTHELMDLDRDLPGEYVLGWLGITKDRRRAVWGAHEPSNLYEEAEAAVFTDVAGPNYAHWLTEVLPRIAAFVQDPRYESTPIVVDLDLHSNIRRSIALIAPGRAVHRLKARDRLRVRRLHHVSVTGYVPYRLRDEGMLEHGRFAPGALRHTVQRLRSAVQTRDDGTGPKLFLRRNAKLRRLVNEPEIEAALAARGFFAVDPAKLTLEEQIVLFSQASMIVGATGAGLANLIFCRPDCPLVVLMPRFRHTAYWYWRRMAAAAGAGPVVHVSGPQVETDFDPDREGALQQDYRVELADVLQGVDIAMSLRR